MAKQLKERVQIGIDDYGKPIYKWATGYTKQELLMNAAQLLLECGCVKDSGQGRARKHLFRDYAQHWFDFVLGGEQPLSYTQTRKMCQRIQQDINFAEAITPRRFRTTVLTDLYDMTKGIKQAQAAAGHTTAAMTLKHYVKGRSEHRNTAATIASAYGLEN